MRYLEPATGWESTENLVTVKVTSVLPEPTLLVRLRTYETEHAAARTVFTWDSTQIFFVDKETLVIKIPPITSLDLSLDNRVVVCEVSLNGGVDWTQETTLAEYFFRPTPQITSLSHYWSNLRADFELTIYGFQFEDDLVQCIFGANLTSPGK